MGLSAFAALNKAFPCDQYLELIKESPAPVMPVLYGTFGKDWSCVLNFIEQNKERHHAIEIHFSNERCRYWGRCFEGELLPSLDTDGYNQALEHKDPIILNAIRGRMYEILLMIQAVLPISPNTHWILTTGLEDSYSEKAALQIYDTIKTLWPYELRRSPVNPNTSFPYLLELHGVQVDCATAPIVSNDGDPIESTSGLRSYVQEHKLCEGLILWQSRAQGITDKFIKPNDRNFSFDSYDVLMWYEFLNLIYGLEYT